MSFRDEGSQGGGEQHTKHETNKDEQDAQGKGETNYSSAVSRPIADMPVEFDSPDYNMKNKRRGLAVIITYSSFHHGNLKPRGSSQNDANHCKNAFEKLKYEVEIHKDLTKAKFIKLLETVRDADHKDCDSLVVVFMSHGELQKETNEEFIWTCDAKVKTSTLWEYFTPEKCPSLAGKPKMFFIQACRGDGVDKGVQLKKRSVVTDSMAPASVNDDYAIPLNADMLMMSGSYPGMFCFRSTQFDGEERSVFIHFLGKVLLEDTHNSDLFSMLLQVTREVAIRYESTCEDQRMHRSKQIPHISSTLMRHIHFC